MKQKQNKKSFEEIKRDIRMNPWVDLAKKLLIVVIIAGCYWLVKIAGFDMMIDCDTDTGYCTISKTSGYKGAVTPISRFTISKVAEVYAEERKLEDGTVIYDILLDCGPEYGKMFIDYGFKSKIKANTVRLKLSRYLDIKAKTIHINKHCYFNDNYFCI